MKTIKISISLLFISLFASLGCGGDVFETLLQDHSQMTVSYNGNGATSGNVPSEPVIYKTGDTVTVLGNTGTLERTGHTFNNWNADQNGGGTAYAENDVFQMPENSITLYAQWTPKTLTVSFNSHDGTPTPADISVTYGSTYSNLPAAPTRAGYIFLGWFTEASGGTEVETSTGVTATADHTLHAQWAPDTLTVSFNSHDGTPTPDDINVTYGSTYSNLPGDPTRTGYDFQGWFTADSGGTKIETTTTVSATADHTLHAQWTPKTLTVSFNSHDGTPTPADINVTYASTYSNLPGAPSKSGYDFQGWFTADSGGTKVETTTAVTATVDHTLHAQWTPKTLTVSFNSHDGTPTPADINVTYGSTYSNLPGDPTRTGYDFKGWFTADSGGTKVITTTAVTATTDHTLHAQWTAKTFTVSFNSHGGIPTPTDINVTYGSTYSNLPGDPTRTGYDFQGWFTADSGGTKVITTTAVTATADHTLHAQWTPKTLTVSFNSHDGTPTPADINVTYASTYSNLPGDPTKTGYDFQGWFTADSGGTKVETTTSVTATADHTLHAQWTPKTLTVSFDSHEGSPTPADINVTYGSTYSNLPGDPTRTGYNFQGWFTADSGGTKVETTTAVTATTDHSLHAQWTVVEYNITYNLNGGTNHGSNPSKYTVENLPLTLLAATKDGNIFAGWYSDSGFTTPYNPIPGGTTGDVTVYAKWTPIVLESISISPNEPKMLLSKTLQFSAIGTYTDNSTKDITGEVTWESDNHTVAEIGATGLAISYTTTGSSTIKASAGGSIYDEVELMVVAKQLTSIVVTPVNPSLAAGMTLQFTATGIYNDDSTENLTDTVTWDSSDTGKAGISNAPADIGTATGIAKGDTEIKATMGAVEGKTTLKVTEATLISLSVTPLTKSLAKGTTQQYTASGIFSDNTTVDMTPFVTWTSENDTIAEIGLSSGLATALDDGGPINITATYAAPDPDVTGIAQLTVLDATLESISIFPENAVTIGYGTYQQFTATGHYKEAITEKTFTQDVTSLATWQSLDPGTGDPSDVASISNSDPTRGRATSVKAGQATIKANYSGKEIDATLTVEILTLASIKVEPEDSSVELSKTVQFKATGVYVGGTEQDLTTQVVWSSTDSGKAIISNALGTQGLATSVGLGDTTIKAARDGVTGATDLTVTTDTTDPFITSVLLFGFNQVLVTFSEPVDYVEASKVSNYLITTSPQGSCNVGDNFSGSTQTVDFLIDSIDILSLSDYVLNLDGTLYAVEYTLIADKINIKDLANNSLDCPNSKPFWGVDVTPPEILNVASVDPLTVRITYSENVNETEATDVNNYKIVIRPMAGDCDDNSNYTSSTQTTDFSISNITGSGMVYTIKLSTQQVQGSAYSVIVDRDKIHDKALTPNAMGCPNYANFTGQEQLKVSEAKSVTSSSFIVRFSKPVLDGVNLAGSAECDSTLDSGQCEKRYKLSDSIGTVVKATILNGTVCGNAEADPSSVCIEHTLNQGRLQYTVTAANGVNFANDGWGSIRDSGNSENVQLSPNDSASFQGAEGAAQEFTDGPIVENPFEDDSDFGYLASYSARIYIGPNSKGNSAKRFKPDGSVPQKITFELNKDTTGTWQSSNTATTRDGGIGVPPYVTMGYTGCTQNNANLATGCGPDNNNGRGLFTSGKINGTEHLFITGGRSAGRNYYLYWTKGTNEDLSFNYIDLSDAFYNTIGGANVLGNRGTESITVFNNKVYWISPGDRTYRPYQMKVFDLTAESVNSVNSRFMMLTWMKGFGYLAATNSNKADIVGGTMHVYGDRLYIANSGSVSPRWREDWWDPWECIQGDSYDPGKCEQTGSIIRSKTIDPGPCTAAGTCADWEDITPADIKYKTYFTDVLTKTADLIPADRPVPGFADYEGNLFMIRNACTTNRWNWGCTSSECTDDTSCPSGQYPSSGSVIPLTAVWTRPTRQRVKAMNGPWLRKTAPREKRTSATPITQR